MSGATTGFVVGKFYPLHAGHLALLSALATEVDEVTVCVLASVVESIPLQTRVRWVAESVPGATVIGGYDESPMGDEDGSWAAHLAAMTAAGAASRYDVVATGDWYGPGLAERLGARLLAWDPSRAVLPVSGSELRADPDSRWWLLPAAIRSDLVRRGVVLGAESTGTTTLARDLAGALGTVWVPEYGRAYSAAKGPMASWVWDSAEFEVIAREQAALEDAAARLSGPVLVCDTDPLATVIWHAFYAGGSSARLDRFAATRCPDLYLLTTPDGVRWEDDGLRDSPDGREAMTEQFRAVVRESGVTCVELGGSRDDRLAVALAAVRSIPRLSFAPPIG
jgi:HTH-type transcriptional repressor of NAD biosynthesis genes